MNEFAARLRWLWPETRLKRLFRLSLAITMGYVACVWLAALVSLFFFPGYVRCRYSGECDFWWNASLHVPIMQLTGAGILLMAIPVAAADGGERPIANLVRVVGCAYALITGTIMFLGDLFPSLPILTLTFPAIMVAILWEQNKRMRKDA